MKRSSKGSKRKPLPEEVQCPACGGRSFKQKATVFPFPLPTGKVIDVAGVHVQECLDCHELTPTYEGRMKLARCLESFLSLPG